MDGSAAAARRTGPSPWLDIPLDAYEAHMALPEVGQASMLADIFGALLREHLPETVAVLGCAGGNGLERIDPAATSRVVCVDINQQYLDVLRERHQGRFARLQTTCLDIERRLVLCEPVSLVWAALLFEYVDPCAAMNRIAHLIADDGILATVVQEHDTDRPAVTPSPYTCLEALAPALRHVAPSRLAALAAGLGLYEMRRQRVATAAGKHFTVQVFQRDPIAMDPDEGEA